MHARGRAYSRLSKWAAQSVTRGQLGRTSRRGREIDRSARRLVVGPWFQRPTRGRDTGGQHVPDTVAAHRIPGQAGRRLGAGPRRLLVAGLAISGGGALLENGAAGIQAAYVDGA